MTASAGPSSAAGKLAHTVKLVAGIAEPVNGLEVNGPFLPR